MVMSVSPKRTSFYRLLLLAWIGAYPLSARCEHVQSASNKGGSLTASDNVTFKDAVTDYEANRLVDAESSLRALAIRNPDNFEVAETLGEVLASEAQLTSALTYFKRACRLAPGQAICHANLGTTYLELKQDSRAVGELQIATALDPHSFTNQYNLGFALMRLNRPKEASAAFTSAFAIQPDNASLAYNLALSLYSAGLLDRAKNVLDHIPQTSPTPDTEELSAEIAERQSRFQDAVEHYQVAARLDPSPNNLYGLIVEYLRHWNWQQARDIAAFAIHKYPADARFPVLSGISLYGNNQYQESATAFSRVLQAAPENDFYADLLGRSCSLVAEGTVADCGELQTFAIHHPENAKAAIYAATSLLNKPTADQDAAQAEHLLHQAILADPHLPEAYYELGVLRQQTSNWKDSADWFRKAISIRPSYAEAHYRLARSLSHMGDREEARKEVDLQQKFSQTEKDQVNAKLRQITTFIVNSGSGKH